MKPPKTRRPLADYIVQFPSQTAASERLTIVEQLQEKLVAHGLDDHFAIRNHANFSKLYLKGKGGVSKATAFSRLSERLGESINEAQLYSILRADMSNDPIVKNIGSDTKDLETELAEADPQYNAFEDEEASSASEAIASATTPIAQRREASSPIARRRFSATSPIWTPGTRTVPNYTRTDPADTTRRWEDIITRSMQREAETWPDGRPSRYYDDVPGVEEPKGDRNYPDGDRPEPYGGDYEDESDDEDDSDSDDEDDEDDSDDEDGEDDEDESDSDDERGGAEVEAIRNFGLISRDPRQMQELSAVVDNAEMRTIDGEPETTEQRDLAKQIAKAIAGTSSFTKADTLDLNGSPKPLPELMRMARVASLWPVLSDLQKDQYMQTTGVLANDRRYISRNVLIGAPIRKKRPFVINAQGKKIQV